MSRLGLYITKFNALQFILNFTKQRYLQPANVLGYKTYLVMPLRFSNLSSSDKVLSQSTRIDLLISSKAYFVIMEGDFLARILRRCQQRNEMGINQIPGTMLTIVMFKKRKQIQKGILLE